MLIAIGQEIGSIFYDAFVAKFDFWLVFGVMAQLRATHRELMKTPNHE